MQGVTRSYRGIQEITRGERRLLEVTGAYKGLPGGAKG